MIRRVGQSRDIGGFDHLVAKTAGGQHAVVTLSQLLALGLGRDGVHYRARCGRLHRLHRGVYALVPPDLMSFRGRLMAAVLACGPEAVASHLCAANLHGLTRVEPPIPEVLAPTPRCVPGVRTHRAGGLSPRDRTIRHGIPVSTLARAFLDLAGELNRPQLDRMLNQADAAGRLPLRALHDQLERHPNARGSAQLRRALLLYDSGAPTESELEDRFLGLIHASGLPAPVCQRALELGDGGPPLRPDFMWPEHRLVVETDGHQYHGTRRAFEADRQRDQRLARAGWRCVRITWRQLIDDPAGVIALLADLLSAAA